MTETGFQELKSNILKMLDDGLDSRLTYHCRAHTEDVLIQAERIALAENIVDSRDLMLIRMAALFHDTGFLRTYKGHEEVSCVILREMAGKGLFAEEELDQICGMIMATKIPQSPKNLFEMILADADLDYLGRDDFDRISNSLKDELLAYGSITDEFAWDRLQVGFFQSHHYFTANSIRCRQPVKNEHLAILKEKLVTQNSKT
jgi:uncharacterized protein